MAVVDALMGAGQGNVMGGDFSENVLLGYKMESGEGMSWFALRPGT